LGHLLGSILGLIFAIFGTFALGVYLTTSRAGRLGLVAVVITVLGSALFLPLQGISTFTAPKEGQAYLAGIEEYDKLPPIFADTMFLATSLLVIVLGFVGNVLLGVAVWRSGTLPKLAGALWVAGAVLMTLIAHSTEGSIQLGAFWAAGAAAARVVLVSAAVWCAVAIGLVIFDWRFWRGPAPAPATVQPAHGGESRVR
jgi:hypothetical protein